MEISRSALTGLQREGSPLSSASLGESMGAWQAEYDG